jgi:hypothetical protein
LNETLHTGESSQDAAPADAAKTRRRQRAKTLAAVGGALLVGVVFFTAGSRSSTTPPAAAPTALATPAATSVAVTTGPPGPTAPTVSVVESTAVGADALPIGSSGTFSTAEASGIVTVRSASWPEPAESASGVAPVIEVDIQVTSGEFMVTLASFGLQDSKGNVYPPLSGAAGDGELASGQLLNAGGNASGVIAFDAPRQPLTLLFSNPSSAEMLTWRMPE